MFSRTRSSIAVLALAGVTLGACGGSTSSDTADAPLPAATDVDAAPATEAATADTTDETTADTSVETSVEATAEAPTGTEPAEGDAPAPTEPAAAPEAVVGGRALAAELAATSDVDGNPLPDLVVDDIARGTPVNLRNVFPAERPVLMWMWAPH